MSINKFKEVWKDMNTFRFKVKIIFGDGHEATRQDVRINARSLSEAKQEVKESLQRDFKYHEVKDIKIEQI